MTEFVELLGKAAPEIGMAALFIFYLLKKDKANMEAATKGHEAAMALAKAVSELKGVIQGQDREH